MKEEDDWFYGSELRINGKALAKEGITLTEDARSLEAELAVKLRRIEEDLQAFQAEKYADAFNLKYEAEKAKVVEEADARVAELLQMRKEKEIEIAQEEKLAHERDGAPSSTMMNEHRAQLKALDEVREQERARMIQAQEDKEAAARVELEAEFTILMSAVANRRALADDRAGVIRKDTRSQLHGPEAQWQGRAARWLDQATRKVAMKEREDAEHAAAKKRKKQKVVSVRTKRREERK